METTQQPNFIFWGTPEFAAEVLEKLINQGVIPKAIVCNPDRPVGRKKIITPPATKLLVLEHQLQDPTLRIDILQPETLDEAFAEKLKSYSPDVFVIAAFAKLIKQDILDIPTHGSIGVPPSLLPFYGRASPMQNALLNGEDTTGVTLFLVDAKMDHGPIVAQETLYIGTMNYTMLSKKLAELGGELAARTLADFVNGTITPQEQDHDKATLTTKFTTEDAFIDMHDIEKAQIEGGPIAQQLECKIRALNPEPGTWTMTPAICSMQFGQEKRVKVLEADVSTDDKLTIKKIHVEGKTPVAISSKSTC